MTDKQRQLLLAYLGYYEVQDKNGNIIIDGIWGEKSHESCMAFQTDFGGIAADGFGGPETDKALKHAVAIGFLRREPVSDGGATEAEIVTFWDEIEFFDREEFRCQCNGQFCDGFHVEPDETMVRICDEIRRRAGVPILIRDAGGSGLRCPQWNAMIPDAAANSLHTEGKAADLHPRGKTPAQLYAIAEAVMAEMIPGRGGLGIYNWGIHIDDGPYSRWDDRT